MKTVIDEIRWEVMAADDFKATCGDYLLRAEQMNKDQWWWMTYFNGDELKVESWASTEEEAMDRAELAMLRHKLVSQQSTLSKEKVSEVLVEQISRFIPITKNTPFIKNSTTAICNLTPAVSDDKLLELLLSENGLDDDRIAKLFKDSRDAEYKAILKALHEAWEEIKQLQSIQLVKDERRRITNRPQMRKEAMMKKILKWLIGDFPWRQICIVIGLLLGCYLEWILAEWIRHFNH